MDESTMRNIRQALINGHSTLFADVRLLDHLSVQRYPRVVHHPMVAQLLSVLYEVRVVHHLMVPQSLIMLVNGMSMMIMIPRMNLWSAMQAKFGPIVT